MPSDQDHQPGSAALPYRSEPPDVQGELSGRILLLDPVTRCPVFGMTPREARAFVRAIQAEMRDQRNA